MDAISASSSGGCVIYLSYDFSGLMYLPLYFGITDACSNSCAITFIYLSSSSSWSSGSGFNNTNISIFSVLGLYAPDTPHSSFLYFLFMRRNVSA